MKLKKVLSVLLASVMTLSLVACGGGNGGSGGNTETKAPGTEAPAGGETTGADEGGATADVGDMPVIRCAFPSSNDMSDAPMVQDAMNKIFAEKYGVQVELMFINMGTWSQQTNLLLTGDEVDVIAFFGLPLTTFVSNGQCLPLDDYVANAGEKFKSLFTQEQMDGTKINGIQYAIPNLRNYGNIFVCFWDEAKLTELGYKAEEITTLEQIEEVLYAAHEKYPDIYTIVPQGNKNFCNGPTWDGLGDQNYIGVIGNCGQDEVLEVKDIFELEDFVDFCNMTHKWYLDGLMMGDALSNQETGVAMIQNGAAFASFSNRACEPPAAGLTQSVWVESWSDSTNITALTYGINPLSKDPDNAWKVLEALYTDSDLMTLLINGIEGVHYEVTEEGGAVYPEGITMQTSTYGNQSMYWAMPYAEGVPPIADLGAPTFFEDLKEFNNTTRASRATGFTLDIDAAGIADQYAACLNVKDKYYDGLMNGILDPATVLPQAHQEMLEAGIQDIIDAKQAIVDELLGQ